MTTQTQSSQTASLSTSDFEKKPEQQIDWVKIATDPNTVNIIGSPSFSFSGSSFPPDIDEADSFVDDQFYHELRHDKSDQESFYDEGDSYEADSSANFSTPDPLMISPNDTDDEKSPLENFKLPAQMSTSYDDSHHHQMSTRSFDERSYSSDSENSAVSNTSKNVTNNGIPKLLIPCRFYGSARGCSLEQNCLYSHENPACVRLCINFFSSGCGYKEQCRFRHTKNSADNLPSKQQSLRDRFRNRFGVLDGDEYFKKFLKMSPEANIMNCELVVAKKLPIISESWCCCSCSHQKAQRRNSETNFSVVKPLSQSSSC